MLFILAYEWFAAIIFLPEEDWSYCVINTPICSDDSFYF